MKDELYLDVTIKICTAITKAIGKKEAFGKYSHYDVEFITSSAKFGDKKPLCYEAMVMSYIIQLQTEFIFHALEKRNYHPVKEQMLEIIKHHVTVYLQLLENVTSDKENELKETLQIEVDQITQQVYIVWKITNTTMKIESIEVVCAFIISQAKEIKEIKIDDILRVFVASHQLAELVSVSHHVRV